MQYSYYVSEYRKAKQARKETRDKNPCLQPSSARTDERGDFRCYKCESSVDDFCENCKKVQPYYEKFIESGNNLKRIKMLIFKLGQKLNKKLLTEKI